MGISYNVVSVPDGGESSEYTHTLIVFLDNKEIGYIDEGEPLLIDGDFRRGIDTGLIDQNGLPILKNTSFNLDINDLMSLQRIIRWWQEENGEQPKDLHKDVEEHKGEDDGKK